jgi:hypothetical protein
MAAAIEEPEGARNGGRRGGDRATVIAPADTPFSPVIAVRAPSFQLTMTGRRRMRPPFARSG